MGFFFFFLSFLGCLNSTISSLIRVFWVAYTEKMNPPNSLLKVCCITTWQLASRHGNNLPIQSCLSFSSVVWKKLSVSKKKKKTSWNTVCNMMCDMMCASSFFSLHSKMQGSFLERGFTIKAKKKNNQASNHSIAICSQQKAGLLDKDKLILIDVLKVNSSNCLRACEITGWVNSALHNITSIDESIKSRRERNFFAKWGNNLGCLSWLPSGLVSVMMTVSPTGCNWTAEFFFPPPAPPHENKSVFCM